MLILTLGITVVMNAATPINPAGHEVVSIGRVSAWIFQQSSSGERSYNLAESDQAESTDSLENDLELPNLLQNPGAEDGPGSASGNDVLPLPGWTTTSNFAVVQYGHGFEGPTVAESQRIGGGSNFFAGGPNNAMSSATQMVDVSGDSAEIDAGIGHVRMHATLAGFSNQGDNAVVKAEFLSSRGFQPCH